jgi:SAM-dependent methyltransferase
MSADGPRSPSTQRDVFAAGEGDAWYRRNREHLASSEPGWMMAPVADLLSAGDEVLEIGCANARNLAWLRARSGCRGAGVDPSSEAIAEGRQMHAELDLHVGTADALPFDRTFDVVLFGFCLYLCDRASLPRIVAEADRVLRPGGHVAIVDFDPALPHRRAYRHAAGVSTFKMDHMSLFLSFPHYSLVHKSTGSHDGPGLVDDPDERLGVWIARKELDADDAWPQRDG